MVKIELFLMELVDDLIADILSAKEDFCFDAVSCDPFFVGREKGSFADVFQLEKGHCEPLKSHPETAVGGHPIFEDAEIVGEVGGIHRLHQNPFDHRVVSVAPLATRGDFSPCTEEIESVGQVGIVFFGVGIKGSFGGFPVGDEDEVCSKFLMRPAAEFPFGGGAEVGFVPLVDTSPLKIELLRFGKGEAGEGDIFWGLDDLVA